MAAITAAGVAAVLTAIAAITAAGVSVGSAVADSKAEDKEKEAIGNAKKEDLAMYQTESRVERRKARENLELDKRQVALSERVQKFTEKKYLDENRKASITDAVSVINDAAVKDSQFRQYMNQIMNPTLRR